MQAPGWEEFQVREYWRNGRKATWLEQSEKGRQKGNGRGSALEARFTAISAFTPGQGKLRGHREQRKAVIQRAEGVYSAAG